MKIGDRVLTTYFGCVVEGEILKVTKSRVRVRFRNQSGWMVEAWRPKHKVQSKEVET